MSDNGKTAIVTGHTSGLGKAITKELEGYGFGVIGWSLESGVDVSDEQSVRSAVKGVFPPIDLLVNCAGVNYINWHEDTPIEEWDRLMDTNARAPWLIAKELIKANGFMSSATILNIVSNASHMPMTNSAAYNASKGAAHILTQQMARELIKTQNITVFGVSPNKLKGTGMSEYIDGRVCDLRGWTPQEAADYQLKSLATGEETDPALVAEFIGFLLSTKSRHKFLNGCIIPYGV
jgi:NAD(P)-dependent dehydrogenase (short-subunit alcohol dehydrogenase family)